MSREQQEEGIPQLMEPQQKEGSKLASTPDALRMSRVTTVACATQAQAHLVSWNPGWQSGRGLASGCSTMSSHQQHQCCSTPRRCCVAGGWTSLATYPLFWPRRARTVPDAADCCKSSQTLYSGW